MPPNKGQPYSEVPKKGCHVFCPFHKTTRYSQVGIATASDRSKYPIPHPRPDPGCKDNKYSSSPFSEKNPLSIPFKHNINIFNNKIN